MDEIKKILDKMYVLEFMAVKPERPDWDGSRGWFLYFLPSFFPTRLNVEQTFCL